MDNKPTPLCKTTFRLRTLPRQRVPPRADIGLPPLRTLETTPENHDSSLHRRVQIPPIRRMPRTRSLFSTPGTGTRRGVRGIVIRSDDPNSIIRGLASTSESERRILAQDMKFIGNILKKMNKKTLEYHSKRADHIYANTPPQLDAEGRPKRKFTVVKINFDIKRNGRRYRGRKRYCIERKPYGQES